LQDIAVLWNIFRRAQCGKSASCVLWEPGVGDCPRRPGPGVGDCPRRPGARGEIPRADSAISVV